MNHGQILRGGSGPPPPLLKLQVAIGFLRNTSTDTLEKQLYPMGPIASWARFIQPSLKYVDYWKIYLKSGQDPLTEFSGSAYVNIHARTKMK